MAKELPKLETLLLPLLLVLALSPLRALVSAVIAAKLWSLLLADQFGAGPSFQSWWGAMLILTFMLHGITRDDPRDDESLVAFTITTMLGHAALGVLLIIIAALTKLAPFSWI